MDCELVIYDIFGREVQKISVADGKEEFQIGVESYTPGVYMIVLKQSFNFVESRKFVVVK